MKNTVYTSQITLFILFIRPTNIDKKAIFNQYFFRKLLIKIEIEGIFAWTIICFFNFIIFVISSMKKTTTQSSKSGRAPFNPKDFERAGVSSEEVLEIRQAFDLFDVEGNGYINPKQLIASMTAFGYQAKNTTLYSAISDCAGNIDFTKFLDLLTARISNKDSKANIKEVFKFFDDEKSGFISIRNLKRVVKEVGENIDDSELQEMIERADLDNDGLISEEEFYAIMTRKSLRV